MEELYVVSGPKTLHEMTSPEAEELLKQTDIAILTVGATEQHGPHLPCGTDTIMPHEYAKRAAKILEKEGIKVIIAPPIPYGISQVHDLFGGTISIRPETLENLIIDVCRSLIDQGINKIVLNLGHTWQYQDAILMHAALRVQQNLGAMVAIFNRNNFYPVVKPKFLKSENPLQESHAGEHETAMILATHPKLVLKEKMYKHYRDDAAMARAKDQFIGIGRVPLKSGGWAVAYTRYPELLNIKTGVRGTGFRGDPTLATPETGNKLLDFFGEEIAKMIKRMIETYPK